MSKVWEINLNPAQKAVILVLADHADENGSCFPGVALISRRTGYAEKTVRRALNDLIESGLIKRFRRNRADGSRTSNRYEIQQDTVTSKLAALKVTTSQPTGHSDRGILEPSVEPSVNPLMVPPKKPRKLETRISESWHPNQQDLDYAAGKGLSAQEIKTQAEKFHNYWIAKAGRSGIKLNWSATWRNWIINAKEYRDERDTIRTKNRTGQSRAEQFMDQFAKGSSA